MGWLEITAAAVVEIEHEIVLEDVVAAVEAEFASGLIDRGTGTFELHESSYGGFVEIDHEALGPFEAGGKPVRGAIFLVVKPAFEAKSFEDFLKGGGISEDQLDLLSDLVTAVRRRSDWAHGKLVGGTFEREKGAGGRFSG